MVHFTDATAHLTGKRYPVSAFFALLAMPFPPVHALPAFPAVSRIVGLDPTTPAKGIPVIGTVLGRTTTIDLLRKCNLL
jgi:hypothetical protein